MRSVPPKQLAKALEYVSQGYRLCVPSAYRTTVIEQKHIDKWNRAGKPLLREDGNGYRMRTGKTSVYLFPGQLCIME